MTKLITENHDRPNLRLTIWLTLALFLMMLCAGGASFYLGSIMGRAALKAVTQPEVDSEDKSGNKKPKGGKHKGLKIINEQDILAEIYQTTKLKNPQSNQSEVDSQTNLVDSKLNKAIDPEVFPIADRSKSVTLEVAEAQYEDSSLLLELNLKNEGSKPVNFLYSFLDIKDDRGQPLSAIPEGLPGLLPADGKNHSGLLRIPLTLLGDAKHISMTLTDYPDRTLELELEQIPVSTTN